MSTESLFDERHETGITIKNDNSTPQSEEYSDRSASARLLFYDTPISHLSCKSEYERGDSMTGISTYRLNEIERTRIRLAKKRREIKAAKEFLIDLIPWLRLKERYFAEVGDWLEAIIVIKNHRELPRVVLGFMGPSGCGKSTVINALLDEEGLLPKSGTEACTAVAVEISWNPISDPNRAYRACIQFFTATEWKAVLDALVAELAPLETAERRDPASDDAKVAAAKIRAVYPDFNIDQLTRESVFELMNDIAVSEWLGKEKNIEKPVTKARSFAAEISQYIASSTKIKNSGRKSGRVAALWPLVKVVRIYIRSPVLRTGLVLVDLPGSGDSNAAREMVAQEYMQQVSAICIVAEIKRALTSKVARNLFGRGAALKRRLLRDGLFDDEHTFFVLTCTDTIDNMEVIRSQELHKLPEVSGIICEKRKQTRRFKLIQDKSKTVSSIVPQKRMRTTGDARIRDKDQTYERKSTDSNDGFHVPLKTTSPHNIPVQKEIRYKTCGNMPPNINPELQDIKSEIASLNRRLTTICIRERNIHVTSRMKADFAAGMTDLEKELREDGEEEAELIPRLSENSIRDGIDVFCVSAPSYQKFRKIPFGEVPIGFDVIEDTSIPQLTKHCKEYTLNACERLDDTLLHNLRRVEKRMSDWADNTITDNEITGRQKRLLEENFAKCLKNLETSVNAAIILSAEKLQDDFQGLSRKALQNVVPAATERARKIFHKWMEEIDHVGVWKAICRKEGVHKSEAKDKKIGYNWNEDLAEEFTKPITGKLCNISKHALPRINKEYKAQIQNYFDNFTKELKDSSLGVTKHILNSLENMMFNIDGLLSEALGEIDSIFSTAIAMSRVIDNKVLFVIRLSMKPGYANSYAMKGQGSGAKSKTAMGKYFGKICRPMYENVAMEVSQGIQDIITILKSNLEMGFKNAVGKVEAGFNKMLATASQTPRPEFGAIKEEFQKEVLEKMISLKALLRDVRELEDATEWENDEEGDIEDDFEDDSEMEFDEISDVDMAVFEDELGNSHNERHLDFKSNDNDDSVLEDGCTRDEEYVHEY